MNRTPRRNDDPPDEPDPHPSSLAVTDLLEDHEVDQQVIDDVVAVIDELAAQIEPECPICLARAEQQMDPPKKQHVYRLGWRGERWICVMPAGWVAPSGRDITPDAIAAIGFELRSKYHEPILNFDYIEYLGCG